MINTEAIYSISTLKLFKNKPVFINFSTSYQSFSYSYLWLNLSLFGPGLNYCSHTSFHHCVSAISYSVCWFLTPLLYSYLRRLLDTNTDLSISSRKPSILAISFWWPIPIAFKFFSRINQFEFCSEYFYLLYQTFYWSEVWSSHPRRFLQVKSKAVKAEYKHNLQLEIICCFTCR